MFKAPKDLLENKKFRLTILTKAANDTYLQALLIRKCSDDFEFFCDTFCWTYDPRETDPHKPFILWPKQVENYIWLEKLYKKSQQGEKMNGFEDKPRGVGATVVFMTWCFWHYIFHEFSARIGSRKEDYVEKKGDPDTLFAKIDYNLARIPTWLIGEHERPYMIIKPKGGGETNSIVGESANPNFGRGGRKSVIGFDEFGFWDFAKSSWESAGEATNMRLALSTPPESGRDSHQYKILTGEAGRVHTFNYDWSDVPGRDALWYQQARETKSEEEFAREVMKSYEGTTRGKVYAISIRRAKLGEYEYHPELPLFVSWDFGLDTTALIWWQKNFASGEVFMIDCYSNINQEIDFFVPFVTGSTHLLDERGKPKIFEYKDFEQEKIALHATWAKDRTHFGDPDVRKRNLINKDSVKDHLQRNRGIYIESIPWGGREWTDMKNKMLLLFPRLHINEKLCEPVLSALRNAKYPERREGSQSQNEPLKPIHDWTSHFRTAAEYFADNEPETLTSKTKVSNVGQAAPKPRLVTAEQHDQAFEERIHQENNEEEMVRVRTIISRLTPRVEGIQRLI